MNNSLVPPCEVCGEPGVGIASSCLGPYSASYCKACVNSYAEPYWLFVYTYYEVGNRGEGLADWVKELTTVKDGKRLTWAEFDQLQKDTNYAEEPEPYDPA